MGSPRRTWWKVACCAPLALHRSQHGRWWSPLHWGQIRGDALGHLQSLQPRGDSKGEEGTGSSLKVWGRNPPCWLSQVLQLWVLSAYKAKPSPRYSNKPWLWCLVIPQKGQGEGYGRHLGRPSAKQLSELLWPPGACAGSPEAGSSAQSSDLADSGEGSTQ